MPKIRFDTLGCKLNQIETESLAHAFREAGFEIDDRKLFDTPDIEGSTTPDERIDGDVPGARTVEGEPVLCVVNTCTVTGKAEQKARRLIRSLLRASPSATVLVTGCYAEVEEPAIRAIDPRVAVFPGSRKGALADLPRALQGIPETPDALEEAVRAFCLAKGPAGKAVALPGADSAIPETFKLSTDDFLFHSRASIKVQDGCDNRCSYCRIRLARGKAVSLDADSVIDRIKRIEDAGWGEVVLSGVNLSQYRSGHADFADILGRILAETGSIGIRIGSLYPERVDEAILPMLANERVCPHFHLSVQSGSDRVLKAMRRPYEADAVIRAVERLRSVKDDPFIACDIIAGFPGETDADFALTTGLCARARFAAIHAFSFSPRPGTEAWDLRPRVPERVAGERVARLSELSARGQREYAERWVGKTVSAVAEVNAALGHVTAVTDNYLSVVVDGYPEDTPRGKRIMVRITGIGTAVMANPA